MHFLPGEPNRPGMSTRAYPKGVSHGRQKGDQTTSNGSPGEDTLLTFGVVEEGL